MDSILIIRQMMAESKFSEAQIFIEAQLVAGGTDSRSTLLPLLLETLEAQNKELPEGLVFELARALQNISPDDAIHWFQKLSGNTALSKLHEYQFFLMRMYDQKGRIEDLRKVISAFQLSLLEDSLPTVPVLVEELSRKYFKHDFHLKAERLAITLMQGDLVRAESEIKELIFSVFERTSIKAAQEKIKQLHSILLMPETGSSLIFYRHLCQFLLHGPANQKDYKHLAELIIYFEDFKLQVIMLHLLHDLKLVSAAEALVSDLRTHAEYDYVYLDKHFQELKKYFLPERTQSSLETQAFESPNLDLEDVETMKVEYQDMLDQEVSDEENYQLIQLFKYQDYNSRELQEIAVSFLQSDLPKVALEASRRALALAAQDEDYLKASYLKMTSQMKLQDYRGALDTALESMQKARRTDDHLSLLYTQAEAYIHLGQKTLAQKTLHRILEIDENYRLTRERLSRLDET